MMSFPGCLGELCDLVFSYVIFFTDLLCFSVAGGGVLKPAVSFDLTYLPKSYSHPMCI